MRKAILSFMAILTLFSPTFMHLKAEKTSLELKPTSTVKEVKNPLPASSSFEAFTGKITKNKVRLRTQPNFDGLVLKELNQDDLLVIVGESDDFYTVQPPSDIKAYIFRTYVLDNVIEGTHVNVRLKPELDAPVLAQLNSGDRVEGSVTLRNPKWLEIALPQSVRFYIAKDYVEKVGDANLIARTEQRRLEVQRLIKTTQSISEMEMQKPFNQIHLDGIIANYKKIIAEYADFPQIVHQAKESLVALQETYTNRKIDYLEQQSQQSTAMALKSQRLSEELKVHKDKISLLENRIQQEKENKVTLAQSQPSKEIPVYPINMSSWFPNEDALFAEWLKQHGGISTTLDDFYRAQKQDAFTLKGIIDPYNRPVKNRPGDYMLLSSSGRLPIAFLYSTKINLQNYVGHEVSIIVVPRPNNHFAFPAYFVLSIE
jgi:hypothetical protein